MKTVNHQFLRKQLVEWRDRQCQAIEDHFDRSFVLLSDEVQQATEKMTVLDTFKGEDFTSREIIPIWERWVKNETSVVLAAAQGELSRITESTVGTLDSKAELPDPDASTILQDSAVTGAVTVGAGIAVKTLLPAAVTTVSSGGVLGFFGATTAVVAWPVAVGLFAAVGVAAAVGGAKIFNARARAIRHYQKKMRAWMEHSAVDSENPGSLVNRLQDEIRRVARASVNHLDRVS